jgi:hypothetical protein
MFIEISHKLKSCFDLKAKGAESLDYQRSSTPPPPKLTYSPLNPNHSDNQLLLKRHSCPSGGLDALKPHSSHCAVFFILFCYNKFCIILSLNSISKQTSFYIHYIIRQVFALSKAVWSAQYIAFSYKEERMTKAEVLKQGIPRAFNGGFVWEKVEEIL